MQHDVTPSTLVGLVRAADSVRSIREASVSNALTLRRQEQAQELEQEQEQRQLQEQRLMHEQRRKKELEHKQKQRLAQDRTKRMLQEHLREKRLEQEHKQRLNAETFRRQHHREELTKLKLETTGKVQESPSWDKVKRLEVAPMWSMLNRDRESDKQWYADRREKEKWCRHEQWKERRQNRRECQQQQLDEDEEEEQKTRQLVSTSELQPEEH